MHTYIDIYRIVQKCLGTFTVEPLAYVLAHYLLLATAFMSS